MKLCKCKISETDLESPFVCLKCKLPIVCVTAPYPKCNGADGCQECEHQPEDMKERVR